MDSFATADVLRAGLMAASRVAPTPPPSSETRDKAPPSAADATAAAPEQQQQQQPEEQQSQYPSDDAEQEQEQEHGSLASVRPGHRQSQVYDPDAALSVAALLAKEMEEDRRLALQGVSSGAEGGGVSASARHASRGGSGGGGTQQQQQQQLLPPKSLMRRSASMTVVGSSSIGESGKDVATAVGPATNVRSIPRGHGRGVLPPRAGGGGAEGLVVADTKASLRRLYDALEGRGMAAIKRNPHRKSRSRVMVRSRIKENTIGWAHILPPFTRKFVSVDELTGAQRSSRVVTVTFRTREPVSLVDACACSGR